MKLVIDTSVLLKWFLEEIDSALARDLLASIVSGTATGHLPSLAIYEVQSGLIQNASANQAAQQMAVFWQLLNTDAMTVHEVSANLLQSGHKVASLDTKNQGHVSPYDAVFHALALDLNATLITADAAHVRKTKVAFGSVVLLEPVYDLRNNKARKAK